jgi:tyrosyl-tRNA synthetase
MDLTAAQIIYPCMQCADIFLLGAKITQLGMDQRKVNMLAREIGPMLGYWKPVVVSHHMLMGLQKPSGQDVILSGAKDPENSSTRNDKISRTIALKMSKSHPDSAIFMTDTREDIKRKISKAWAPEGEIKENPVLEYCKYIIFPALEDASDFGLSTSDFKVERPEKFGGNLEIKSYEEGKIVRRQIASSDGFETDCY